MIFPYLASDFSYEDCDYDCIFNKTRHIPHNHHERRLINAELYSEARRGATIIRQDMIVRDLKTSYDKDILRPLEGDKYEHIIPHPDDNYIDETIECTNCSHPKFDHYLLRWDGDGVDHRDWCGRRDCDCEEFANDY